MILSIWRDKKGCTYILDVKKCLEELPITINTQNVFINIFDMSWYVGSGQNRLGSATLALRVRIHYRHKKKVMATDSGSGSDRDPYTDKDPDEILGPEL